MHSDYIKKSIPAGISKSNREKLTILHRGANGPFTIHEASILLDMNPTRTRRFLAYLASRGWLSRVRQGLYVTVPLEATYPNEWREDSWIIATKAFEPCYIGGWSACEHWGFTEQIFRTVAVFTAYNARSRDYVIQETPFRLKTLPREKIFIGTLIVKPIRHCLHFWDLKDIEVTEVGPLLKKSSSVIKQITDCDQVYFCMWSHANWKSGHIHFVLQPSWNRYQDRYTGPGPLLQIEMIKERNIPSEADVEEFCNKARELYA